MIYMVVIIIAIALFIGFMPQAATQIMLVAAWGAMVLAILYSLAKALF